jgi:hypothetical protein
MQIPRARLRRNLRRSLGEVAIIVLGVLIALGLEQTVESWEWRNKVRAAEEAMLREIFWDNAPQMYQRVSLQPCINAQLDAIRTATEAGEERSRIAGLVANLFTPFVTYDTVAHENATASDIASHMARDRVSTWTQAYAMLPMVDRANTSESANAARLRAFRRAGGPVSEAETIELLQAVEAVRDDGLRMVAGINWTMRVLPNLGGRIDQERLRTFMTRARTHYGNCARPLPSDWPKTPLPPLPSGPPPGLSVRGA